MKYEFLIGLKNSTEIIMPLSRITRRKCRTFILMRLKIQIKTSKGLRKSITN